MGTFNNDPETQPSKYQGMKVQPNEQCPHLGCHIHYDEKNDHVIPTPLGEEAP